MGKMKYFRRWSWLFAVAAVWLPLVLVEGAGIAEDPALCDPIFWQGQLQETEPVLDDAGRKRFNRKVREASASMVDLKAFGTVEDGAKIRGRIETSSALSGAVYSETGEVVSEADKASLAAEMALDSLSRRQKILPGVTVRRTDLRTLPTADRFFAEPAASMFDVLQETAVDPSEPLLILHTSRSGAYYYVQLYNYRGWVKAADVAVASRKDWLAYVEPKSFLVVKDKSYRLSAGGEEIFYQMGSRLPVAGRAKGCYSIRLPQRDRQGRLIEKQRTIELSPALADGYLPYTRANLLRASFCYLGEPYGWGGLERSVDCSSLVSNVYRTVGILLPRNADEQEGTAGRHFVLAPLDEAAVYRSIHRNLQPGDTLHMDGHVMIYLGEAEGIPYVIHALGSHTEFYDDGTKQKERVLAVVVSDLSLRTSSGDSFAGALTTAASFR